MKKITIFCSLTVLFIGMSTTVVAGQQPKKANADGMELPKDLTEKIQAVNQGADSISTALQNERTALQNEKQKRLQAEKELFEATKQFANDKKNVDDQLPAKDAKIKELEGMLKELHDQIALSGDDKVKITFERDKLREALELVQKKLQDGLTPGPGLLKSTPAGVANR